MKIAWLPALIFSATLALVAANLDLGPIIKIAQCRSMCLRHHMIDGNCWRINKTITQINDCDECWDTCEVLGLLEKEKRQNMCEQRGYQDVNYIRLTIPRFVPLNLSTPDIPLPQECQGCKTACTFFQTRGTEEEKYEPTKLPAPEENKTIHMNDYDVAVLMKKGSEGIWEEENYYYAKQQPTMVPDGWIIVVTDDGVVKQYSWEKWWPKLQSLKTGGHFYQAYITWQDWRTQLKDQREKYISNSLIIFDRQAIKEKQYKSSFVVTWQQEMGDGITGNQVTDSESAQISLPCGKYLVRVATNDGPGSYPIIIDTGDCETSKISLSSLNQFLNNSKIVLFITFSSLGLVCSTGILLLYVFEKYEKYEMNEKESRMEEGCLTEAEKRLMKKESLTKMQKKLMNQNVLRLWPNHSTVNLQIKETDTNVNASVKTQDTNASTQNTNVNVIQKT